MPHSDPLKRSAYQAKLVKRRKDAGCCIACNAPRGDEGTAFHCRDCADIKNARQSFAIRQAKLECYAAYGGAFCACCGEDDLVFLTLDHMNNDGGEHRRQLSGKNKGYGGLTFYRMLKRQGYPTGFQVLCFNCNVGRARNGGVCPHKLKYERSDAIA